MKAKLSYSIGKDGTVTQIKTQEVTVTDSTGTSDENVRCIMQTFTHPKFGSIRVLNRNGEISFVLDDVAWALGYESLEDAKTICESDCSTMELTLEEGSTPVFGILESGMNY